MRDSEEMIMHGRNTSKSFMSVLMSCVSPRLHMKQEVLREDCKSGVMSMPMPPLPPPLTGGVQQQVNDLDKKLMPPPPPPPTGHDRGEPDRKKVKGALGSVTGLFSLKGDGSGAGYHCITVYEC